MNRLRRLAIIDQLFKKYLYINNNTLESRQSIRTIIESQIKTIYTFHEPMSLNRSQMRKRLENNLPKLILNVTI